MIRLARRDLSGLIRIEKAKGGPLPCSLDDPPRALAELRQNYADATRTAPLGNSCRWRCTRRSLAIRRSR